MTPDAPHARFTEWDAAYVLGALTPPDRRAFEDHLAGCDECRRAVAELLPTVGLLSRVTAERAESIPADPAAIAAPDAGARAGLLSIARARRRRRRRAWTAVSIAAAVLVVAAIAVPATIAVTAPPPAPTYALVDVAGAPLEASVRLTQVAWGTRIDLECGYTATESGEPAQEWPYALAVVGADGTVTTVGTWRAIPGSTVDLSAATDLTSGQIAAIEIRTIDGGRVLMRYAPGATGFPAGG
jgi:hypothetical protein